MTLPSLEIQQVSLAYNIYTYLMNAKQKVVTINTPRALHVTNPQDTLKFAKLLSKPTIITVLKYIDGTTNLTQLSKELHIARPNMSNYLQKLKENNLITVTQDGRIHKKISSITTNFEVGIQ